jgi:hypothetical protein
MTKSIITSCTAFVCSALLLAGTTTALASEVIGTLSSDASTTNSVQATSGSITGTVTGGSSGGSGGGGSRSSSASGNLSTTTPSGSILGATADNPSAPGFPNTGVAPTASSVDQSLWSTVMDFLKSVFSF